MEKANGRKSLISIWLCCLPGFFELFQEIYRIVPKRDKWLPTRQIFPNYIWTLRTWNVLSMGMVGYGVLLGEWLWYGVWLAWCRVNWDLALGVAGLVQTEAGFEIECGHFSIWLGIRCDLFRDRFGVGRDHFGIKFDVVCVCFVVGFWCCIWLVWGRVLGLWCWAWLVLHQGRNSNG